MYPMSTDRRYWEPMRIPYNLALAALSLACCSIRSHRAQMRFLARVHNHPQIKRLMAHVTGDGSCLLYSYDSDHDTACLADDWFENPDQAFDHCARNYGVERNDWFVIAATAPHCQDDWITPTRIPGRETGNPDWGRLQMLIDGRWTEVDMHSLPKVAIDYSQLKPMEPHA